MSGRQMQLGVDGAYLERGRPVTIQVRWGNGGGPRNVLIRRESGEVIVRPFRGLRRRRDREAEA